MSFNFIRQHNYCVSGKKAVKSYPDGVYLCVDHGGVCGYRKCCNLVANGVKMVDNRNLDDKMCPP